MTNNVHQIIKEYIVNHPDQTFRQIAQIFDVSLPTISGVAKTHGLSRSAGGLSEAKVLKNLENNALQQ